MSSVLMCRGGGTMNMGGTWSESESDLKSVLNGPSVKERGG